MMNSRQNIAVSRVADYNQLFKQPSVINPYFLTQQSANLIEDFVLEIGRGSSLFLLYGESGVGKSSLLRQISDKRLADFNTHWIDFNRTSVGANGESTSDSIDLAKELKALAEKAEVGDVIFVDHFEAASNRGQHQLFESWSIDGRDKQLNFIVASESASFTKFQQLAQQMQVEARSFQLMPCNPVEAETYVRSVLFPEEPFAKLLIPQSLKQQFHACQGVLGRLIEFVEHEGEQIGLDTQVSEKSNSMASVIAGILLLVIVAAGYLFYSTQIIEVPVEAEKNQSLNHEMLSDNDIVTVTPAPLEEPKTNQLEQLDEQVKVEETVTEIAVSSPSLTEPSKPEVTEPEAAKPEVTKLEATAPSITVEDATEVNPFQSMLDNSKHWIENRKRKNGTIQIMSVGFDRFGPADYEKYMQALQSKHVDTSQLRFFLTEVNNSETYTIVYGVYPSRRDASLQIKVLPEALVSAGPFTRTIGGILDEIEKFQNR